jgi:hypothetical protein
MAEAIITRRGGTSLSFPTTSSQNIFVGATVPLTHYNNTIAYENNYEYASNTHNITITGLDDRATIINNGSKFVVVNFDVSSDESSLKNFMITCVKGYEILTYKGLHAHYGVEISGILTFAFLNITPDGSEGLIGTNYVFIETNSTTLPLFPSETTLFNGIYPYQVLNVLIGKFSLTSIGDSFLRSCYAFNQPLTIPDSVTSIGALFLVGCYAFNQPLNIPDSVTSIGALFLQSCFSFNQPLTIPDSVTSIGASFLQNCHAFNQPLNIPNSVTSIGASFLQNCFAFNQPLNIPNSVTSIGALFLVGCYAFNQPLTIPDSVTSIGTSFLNNTRCLTVLIYNSSVFPTDNDSLSQIVNNKTSTIGTGIIVYGTNRTGLLSALPNRTNTPFRKLIDGGY